MWRRCAPWSALCRGSLLPRAAAAPACRVIAQPLHATRALATRRGLSLLAGESSPPSTTRASGSANLENTYIMRIEPELLEGQPEMVRRMFMLLNGRRSDLTKAQKQAALLRHRQFVDDTGSPEVQAAVLSRGIHAMSAHLSANKKDNNCKRILTRLIHRRRKVLQHLYRLSPKRYFQVSHRAHAVYGDAMREAPRACLAKVLVGHAAFK
jgi:small subunit ribosomal protein S15